MWFIAVLGTNSDWSHGEWTDYPELEGIIGPFETRDEAVEHDRTIFQQFHRTEVFKPTPPGENIYEYKYLRE